MTIDTSHYRFGATTDALDISAHDRIVQRMLAQLRLVPDEIILRVAKHDFDMGEPDKCVVGGIVREAIAAMMPEQYGSAAEVGHPCVQLPDGRWLNGTMESIIVKLYGGDTKAWDDLFYGVCNLPDVDAACEGGVTVLHVERAMLLRVEEIQRAAQWAAQQAGATT